MELAKVNKILPVLFIMLLAACACAVPEDSVSFLQHRAKRIECHAEFSLSVAKNAAENIREMENSFTDTIGKLNTNLSRLESYAEEGNIEGFNSEVTAAWQNTRELNRLIREEKKKLKDYNVSQQIRAGLRQHYSTAREDFRNCVKNNLISFAENRVRKYEGILERWGRRAQKLKEKGIETSAMESIITDAGEHVITKLQEAVDTNNSEAVQSALRQYCLDTGCSEGINYHFFARIQTAMLGAILDSIEQSAGTELDEMLSQARASLKKATDALEAAGTAPYTKESKDAVWENIKECARTSKQIIAVMNSPE